MKRLLAIILTFSMAVSVLMLPVSAELAVSGAEPKEIRSMVVLGDSISTGYGLEGTIYTRTSYANHVAKALDLNFGTDYVNYAVDGYTSAQVFQKAKAYEKTVAEADLIMMTVGGNDVMWKMLAIAMQAVGVNTFDLTQIAIAMAQSDPMALTATLYSAENVAVIEAAIANYRTNLTAMIEYLRTVNPDARVLFLTQYNPTSGLTAFGVLQAYSEAVLTQLNTAMTEVVTAGGYEIVDTHAVMVGRGAELSNILSGDIHPNVYGHAMMADMVKEYLNLAKAEETTGDPAGMTTTLPQGTTTASPTVTTAPAQTTAVTTTAPVTVTAATTAEVSTAVTEPTSVSEAESSAIAVDVTEQETDPDNREDAPQVSSGKSTVTAVAIGVILVVIGGIAAGIGIALFKKH